MRLHQARVLFYVASAFNFIAVVLPHPGSGIAGIEAIFDMLSLLAHKQSFMTFYRRHAPV
ncbi:MAG: hypothetical protein V4724_10695 [Pseudomonadota bacterium]